MTPINENARTLGAMFTQAGFEIRLVGGAVRDFLRGEEPKDLDFCTDATPDEMLAIAKANGVTFVPTGIQHGTATIVINHEPFEVTTLRIDTDTDGRHADVEFTRSFELDAERRDLTINAMSMDFQGNIFDFFGGREDLESNTVRFVGDAEKRIAEDFLRILRFFRFAARMEASMDRSTLSIIGAMREGLDQISRERIWMEMSKLFKARGRVRVFAEMQALGVANQIGLPNINAGSLQFAESAESAVALFFRDNGEGARKFCNDWKMSGDETAKIVWIAENFWKVNRHGREQVENWLNEGKPREWVVDLATLHWDDRGPTAGLDFHARDFQTTEFPVKGQDLLDAGMKPGKEMGFRLRALREQWVASRFTLSREELMAL
jgi:tRNA nucleotidyltransferase (CCA-adding enzyme)